MKKDSIEQFNKERLNLNRILMEYTGKNLKRFLSIDRQIYDEGVLSRKTKELIGLVSSFVLRCDDCIKYHLNRCFEEGVSDKELEEALSIGLIISGSITIPHLRRVFSIWKELSKQNFDEDK